MAQHARSRPEKAVVVSDAPGAELHYHLTRLDLSRRALSLPVESEPPRSLTNFAELWGPEPKLRSLVARWPFPARAWLVSEFVPVSYERTWRSGVASPGLRMVSTVHRRPDLSRDAFEQYWLGPHAAVAKSYTVPVWHYVQNVVLEALGHDSDVDGFVGMHFRTAEELRSRWRDHPREAARGADDAANFMATERSVAVTTIETVWDDGVSARG